MPLSVGALVRFGCGYLAFFIHDLGVMFPRQGSVVITPQAYYARGKFGDCHNPQTPIVFSLVMVALLDLRIKSCSFSWRMLSTWQPLPLYVRSPHATPLSIPNHALLDQRP